MQEIRYETPTEISSTIEFFKGEREEQARKMQNALAKVEDSGATVLHVKRAKIGRNTLCPCGSGKKFKKCCITKAQ